MPASTAPTHAVLLLVRWRWFSLPAGLLRLMLGPWGVGKPEGLCFTKVLGTGLNGGFGLWPGLRHQGLMAFFQDAASAQRFVRDSRVLRARRLAADESLLAVLRVTSARGSWDGHTLAVAPGDHPEPGPDAPVAALTRASIRPVSARRFWRHSPGSERALAQSQGCRLAIGLGEAPVLRQATFSLWDSVPAMRAYAAGGAHGHAAQEALRQGWFSEWLFARFEPLSLQGRWQGHEHP
jgi:hypothetical protein